MRRAAAFGFRLLLVFGILAPIPLTSMGLELPLDPWRIILSALWAFAALVMAHQQLPGTFAWTGLTRLYPKYSDATYMLKHYIGRAKKSVKIADTYLGDFDTFQDSFRHALKSSAECEIRLLVARPDGNLAAARGTFSSTEITNALTALDGRVEAFRRQFGDEVSGLESRVQLRRFDVMIPGPIVIIDDTHVFVGSFLQSGGSQHSPMQHFVRRFPWHRVPQAYVKTFDKLWARE